MTIPEELQSLPNAAALRKLADEHNLIPTEDKRIAAREAFVETMILAAEKASEGKYEVEIPEHLTEDSTFLEYARAFGLSVKGVRFLPAGETQWSENKFYLTFQEPRDRNAVETIISQNGTTDIFWGA